MSKLDKVRTLLDKAGRKETPIEEARTLALLAARMIAEKGFVVVEQECNCNPPQPTTEYDSTDYDVEVPGDFSTFVDVMPFSVEVSKRIMQCEKCHGTIIIGVPYARECQSDNPRVTHFDCKSYFIGG